MSSTSRVRINAAIVHADQKGSSPRQSSFELDASQSVLALVDLCLKPHLGQQLLPSQELKLWPSAIFGEQPVFMHDLDDTFVQAKASQALSTSQNAASLGQLQVKQLLRPTWSGLNVLHILVFVPYLPQVATDSPLQQHPHPAGHTSQQQNPPINHPSALPFLQYLGMPINQQTSASIEQIPYLQNMHPPSLPNFAMPSSQSMNSNIDPVLAAMGPFQGISRPNISLGRPAAQNNSHIENNAMRSSLGTPSASTDARQDISLGAAAASSERTSLEQDRATDMRQSLSESTSSRKGGNTSVGVDKTNAPRYVCDEKSETDDNAQCSASFARPYDLNRHKSTKHGIGSTMSKNELACNICSRTFSRRDALLRHQRVKNHGPVGSNNAAGHSSTAPYPNPSQHQQSDSTSSSISNSGYSNPSMSINLPTTISTES